MYFWVKNAHLFWHTLQIAPKFFWCNLKPIESLNNDSDDGSENVAAVFFNAGDLGGGGGWVLKDFIQL